jgi:hypothetical protein
MRAYFRAGNIDQPTNYAGICSHKGQDHVSLMNMHGVLAVYAITPADCVRRLED